MRTYSVRAIRPEIKEIDIEFAMHDGVTKYRLSFRSGCKAG